MINQVNDKTSPARQYRVAYGGNDSVIRTRELSLQTSRHWGIKRNHAKDARWRGSVLHVADVVETGVVADYQGPAPTIKHVSTIQSLETGLVPGSKSKQKRLVWKNPRYTLTLRDLRWRRTGGRLRPRRICTTAPRRRERWRPTSEALRIGLACERKRQNRSEDQENGQSNGRKSVHGTKE